jgi:hypothetical protein
MSTTCKIRLSQTYTESQCRSELAWLETEADRVREEMTRRPSKIRHLRDLERQMQDHRNILINGVK